MKLSKEINYTKYLEIDQFDDKMIIQDYICPLCTGVYNVPIVDNCGHVFCKSCLNQSLEKSIYCPISYKEINLDSVHPIPFISTIIQKQAINCKNKCGWNNTLSNYENHLQTDCPNILLNCIFEPCKECYLRSEKEVHEIGCPYRQVSCEFCKENILFLNLENHYDICPKIKVKCSQECGIEIERWEISEHINKICSKSIVSCIFKNFGCEETFLRSEEIEHYTEKQIFHNQKTVVQLVENKILKIKVESLENELSVFKNLVEKFMEENNLKNFSEIRKEDQKILAELKINSHQNGEL